MSPTNPPLQARPTQRDTVIEMSGITVQFPGVLALDGVDLRLRRGEVHALLGENGAGKSTLVKALTGVHGIDGGSIVVDGVDRTFSSTADAERAGIATVYQEVNLCPNLSVGENITLGHEPRRRGVIDWRGAHEAAVGHLRRFGLDLDPRSLLGGHPLAVRQLVAICRAMVLDANVLILDEPTSSLDRGEVERLFSAVRDLRDQGVAVVFISHFLDQVYEISDRITVLRNGRLVGEYTVDELPRAELVSRMIGRELAELEELGRTAAKPVDRTATPVLRASGLGRSRVIEPVDLDVYPGEVVGLAGLLGSGRTELARLLAGADTADAGTVEMHGRPVRLTTPRRAIRHGVAFSSEDRRGEGVVGDLTVAENILLGLQARRGWLRPLRRAERTAVVAEYIEALGVRPANPDMLVRNLSGGNQQKVLLGRWLATAPELLILDEPTRGIDVGAKADIQRKVADLAERGLSVLFISSELEEVLRLAQRILIMRDRRRIGLVESRETDVDGLVAVMAHTGRPATDTKEVR
ncbi:MAG: sugar ABC transporter ATP-binding protein [Actinobacteria bacterium]|nr:sugar ABC transporter ATP-binding protein [Actinomycetota bacterium]